MNPRIEISRRGGPETQPYIDAALQFRNGLEAAGIEFQYRNYAVEKACRSKGYFHIGSTSLLGCKWGNSGSLTRGGSIGIPNSSEHLNRVSS